MAGKETAGSNKTASASLIVAMIVSSLATPSSADDNEGANRLFVESVQLWEEIELIGETESRDNRQVDMLEVIQQNLNSIIEDFSGSELAVKLISGEKVGPLSVTDVATALAIAEQEIICIEMPDAKCLILEANDVVQEIVEPYDLDWILIERLIAPQIEMGMISQAQEVIQELASLELQGDESEHDAVLSLLVGGLASDGAVEEAELILREMQDGEAKVIALVQVYEATQNPRYMDEARRLIEGIDEIDTRAFLMAIMASAGSEVDGLSEAIVLLRDVEEFWTRVRALMRIAKFTQSEMLMDEIMASLDLVAGEERLQLLLELSVSVRDQQLTVLAADEVRKVPEDWIWRPVGLAIIASVNPNLVTTEEVESAAQEFEPGELPEIFLEYTAAALAVAGRTSDGRELARSQDAYLQVRMLVAMAEALLTATD